ncbi:unnamed protein product [Hymenolepis diminuta]|uniref:FERM domain-containing protein n=1 Tax=Hymenolepis diminuta TaxID=6216 RepID=A0A0R3S8B3_HYMDI|nr:unnamed protein product [Hymenolepis diminuta]
MAIEARHYIRNRILISVDLFGHDRLNLTAEKNWTIANIYTEVCDYLAIPESRLFGLAKKLDYGFVFLNPEIRLSALEKKSPSRHMSFFLPRNKNKYSLSKASELAENAGAGVILIYLRVRYYVPNQCLRGRVVRHLYYEQLQLNVLNYGLLCSDEIYFQLAAFSIKLYLLTRRNSKCYKSKLEVDGNNVKLSDHFPQFMIDNYGSDYLYDNIPSLLAPLKGQGRESVEWRFIRLASEQSSDFNLHLYPVSLSDLSHLNNSVSNTTSSTTSLLSSPINLIRRSHSGRSSILKTSGKGTFWLGIGPNGFEFHEENRLQYNESYVYSEGEVVAGDRLHGNPDVTKGDKLLVETSESPLFPRIAVSPSRDASDSGVVRDEELSQKQEHRQSAYI